MSGIDISRLAVVNDILEERERQEDKWGVQHWPDGTHPVYRWEADRARDICNEAYRDGTLTWWLILEEEFCETGAEVSWPKLRAELIQVAAVCMAWIEDGDQRHDAVEDIEPDARAGYKGMGVS